MARVGIISLCISHTVKFSFKVTSIRLVKRIFNQWNLHYTGSNRSYGEEEIFNIKSRYGTLKVIACWGTPSSYFIYYKCQHYEIFSPGNMIFPNAMSFTLTMEIDKKYASLPIDIKHSYDVTPLQILQCYLDLGAINM